MATYKQILTSFVGNPDVDTPPSAAQPNNGANIPAVYVRFV